MLGWISIEVVLLVEVETQDMSETEMLLLDGVGAATI